MSRTSGTVLNDVKYARLGEVEGIVFAKCAFLMYASSSRPVLQFRVTLIISR